tara:strand:+ start:13508 stop:14155 length:648 start_codon:yes stop_codon:yes gene_type:complete
VEDAGVVTITDKCGTLVVTLDPSEYRTGRLFAEWDVPLDLKPGVYTEKWTGIQLADGRILDKTHKIWVSDEPYCFEQIPMPEFDIRINKITLYKPTIEPVIFTMHNPEFIIFPKTEARLFRSATISVPMKVTVTEGGPGFHVPVQFNSFDEPVLVVDKDVTSTTEFFPLTSWEDKAYFLLDTTDLVATTYRVQLRIYLGEFQYVERHFSFKLKEF